MKTKAGITAGLLLAVLMIFYLISILTRLNYYQVDRDTDLAREKLQSTDLSGLSVAGDRIGDILTAVTDEFEGTIYCEDGEYFYSPSDQNKVYHTPVRSMKPLMYRYA